MSVTLCGNSIAPYTLHRPEFVERLGRNRKYRKRQGLKKLEGKPEFLKIPVHSGSFRFVHVPVLRAFDLTSRDYALSVPPTATTGVFLLS